MSLTRRKAGAIVAGAVGSRQVRAVRADRVFVMAFSQDLNVFTKTGAPIAQWRNEGTSIRPGPHNFSEASAIAISPHGNVVVADNGYDRVVWLTQDGELVAGWGGIDEKPATFIRPIGIAFDATGAVYVSETRGGRIFLLSPQTEVIGTLADGFPKVVQPELVATHTSGSVVVLGVGQLPFHVFDSEGQLVTRWGFSDLSLRSGWAPTGKERYAAAALITAMAAGSTGNESFGLLRLELESLRRSDVCRRPSAANRSGQRRRQLLPRHLAWFTRAGT